MTAVTSIDPVRLAKAIRLVEQVEDEKQAKDWDGPPSEWYDEYAVKVAAAYETVDADL